MIFIFDFKPFAFKINDDGLPELVDGYVQTKVSHNRRSLNLIDIDEYEKRHILELVYSNGNEFKNGELVRQIKIACKHYFEYSVGDNKIKEFITECKNLNILEQDKPRNFSDIDYTLNSKEIFGLLGKSDRKKILIVTDPKTQEMVLTMFSDSDLYELYFAPDGQEAVFKAVMVRPDLIVSDLELPDFDGIMLARILYILGHPFPLVFLSDKSDKKTITKASKLEGIKGFLLKSEIKKDHRFIQNRIEGILDVSDADKARLQASYETIDIEKIDDFTMESSIWASLTP